MLTVILSVVILVLVPIWLQWLPRDREGERQARERLGLPR